VDLQTRPVPRHAPSVHREEPEIIDALEHESDADAHFVHEMRDVWGIARDD
jgi:hypothetical protein